ncbi:Flagellin protein FlaB [Thermodesulfovibrio sp. N1]|uniref:flagellin N-terminal helical domain-containing protein n=1 Tax=Thermodesulfovibrio sp. N1 TaxID=1871110 RepID=UPI00083B7C2A|nr:flagellin [Thermodesulfovibrio sp. N1]ODA44286.1 Flagellin protein FlaB [Thermodesulfovibrio sp. N1]
MALKINFNPEAAVTHTALLQNERAMNKSLLRISTGNRILSAADDAAGLFIADQLSVVAAALQQGNRNIQTGISALQIAETNVGQIFDKLKTIYTKAQSAANDINDPNARAAIQRDIANLVDAIQKLGTDTEYNGIRLLDGTFSDKVIHYGARANQTITVGISSVKANDLGAFMVTGAYTTNSVTAVASATTVDNGYSTTSGAVASNTNFRWDTGDQAVVSGINVGTGLSFAVDAKTIANNINSSTTLQNAGISARAVNTSTARTEWQDIQTASNQTVSIQFFVGSDTTGGITINVSGGGVLTLSDLVTQINTQASSKNINITAKAENNKLVLTTQGETIGLQVSVTSSSAAANSISVDMARFLGLSSTAQNVSATSTTANSATATGSAIQVGKLVIMGTDQYNYNFSGISSTTVGLGINPATGNAGFKNLYSLDVTTNENAELALDIVKTALQKTDKIRTQIGSVINNLQAIWDGQKASFDNTKEAENVIRNTDFAEEMSTFTTMQIRMQAGMAMLAQANALPQLVLQLLR